MKYSLPIVFLLLFGAQYTFASAACVNMQLQIPQTAYDLTNNPSVSPAITVKANTNPGGCQFFLTVDYGSASSYSSRALSYANETWPLRLSKDITGLKIIKAINDVNSQNDILEGVLASGSNDRQSSLNFYAALDLSNPWRKFGNYSGQFTVRLYRGTINDYTYIDSRTMQFSYNNVKRVDISIVPTSGSFDISDTLETLNFGQLSKGQTRSCNAILKYNAGFMLFASSENNGRLKHTLHNEHIEYTATFSGITASLSGSAGSPVRLDRVIGVSPASGRVVPIQIIIGEVAGKRAGAYSDTIRLTVQSAE